MLSLGINNLPAKETKKTRKLLKDLSVTTSANDGKLSTELLFEISLFMSANNPFAVPIT